MCIFIFTALNLHTRIILIFPVHVTFLGTVHPGCLPHERHNCDAGLHCPKHCEGGGGSGGGGGGEIYLLKLFVLIILVSVVL